MRLLVLPSGAILEHGAIGEPTSALVPPASIVSEVESILAELWIWCLGSPRHPKGGTCGHPCRAHSWVL
eukprot:scaffold7542_cov57-Phaeocystis_antarctica.AAC.2